MFDAGLLRVPEDANAEIALGVLEPLDRAVRGMGGHRESRSQPSDPLMMVRGNRRAGRYDFSEPTPGNRHLMAYPLAHLPPVQVAIDVIADVLIQIATEGHVEQLETPTDPEDRKIALEGAA